MKQLNSYRLFKKVVRKYYKRHDKKIINIIDGKRIISYWGFFKLWCYYLLKEEDYDNPWIRSQFELDMPPDDIESFINQNKPLIGKKVKVLNVDDEYIGEGIFKGIAAVNFGIALVVDEQERIRHFYFTSMHLQEYEG